MKKETKMTKPKEEKMRYKDKIQILGKTSRGFGTKKVYFSSSHTLGSWFGGKGEQLIWEFSLGKYRFSIWKNL